MKLKTLLLTTALVTSSAFADAPAPMEKKHAHHSGVKFEEYYAKVEAGVTLPTKFEDVKFKVGPVFGVGAGYRFSEFFRTDLMFQYRHSNGKKITGVSGLVPFSVTPKATSYGAMLNGYVDGHNDTIFTPYLMAGVGVSHSKLKITAEALGAAASASTKGKINFAWNVGAGIQTKVQDQITIDLGYRYADLGKLIKGANKHLKANEILAGLIWQF